MPRTTVISSQVLATPNVEVTFATLAPTFDRLNVYADLAPLTGVPVTWRLYATTAGIRALAAELKSVTYNQPLDPFSGGGNVLMNGIKTIAADTYDLVASLDYYVPAPITVKAGVIGYDDIINDAPPEVNNLTLSLVYDTPIVMASVTGVHTHFQAELDMTALGQESTSLWGLYGTIVDGPRTITAPIAKDTFNPDSAPSLTSIFFRLSGIGVDTLTLVGTSLVNDPATLLANPVTAALSGFSDTVDGTGGGGGGITQLTTDVTAGPGAGVQAASVVRATGELTGPAWSGGFTSWWLPNKAGSIGLYNSPDGSPVSIIRVPGGYPSVAGAYTVLNADGSNVYLGGSAAGADPIQTHIKAQHGVFIHGESDRVVRRTIDNISNGAQSLWQVQQPSMFSNIEPYGGGAGAFTCDTGLYTTSLIECRFAIGGGGGTINLPALANPGRVLHIGDGTGTISLGDPLVIQPLGGKSVGGGAPGVALTITTTGWAQKLVLDSSGSNWMIF